MLRAFCSKRKLSGMEGHRYKEKDSSSLKKNMSLFVTGVELFFGNLLFCFDCVFFAVFRVGQVGRFGLWNGEILVGKECSQSGYLFQT